MPRSFHSKNISVSLVAVPEMSAAIVYGMHEVFSCVGGAWEALTGVKANCGRMIPRIVGSSTDPIHTTLGATIVPDHSFKEAHRSDVVIVGDLDVLSGLDPIGKWEEAVSWIKDQHQKGAIICSVCTGALMLAEAGLLDDLEATSHWSANDYFKQCYPNVMLKPDRILVPSGAGHQLVTSGGSSSWHELSLYLIARFCGEDEARHIAKVFLFGDRSDGQLPFAAMVRPKQHEDATIAHSQTWIAENYEETNPVAKMTLLSGLNARTFKRRFKSATGYTPLEYVQTLRIEEAKQMLETSDEAIDDIAESVGYDEPNSFRRLFKRTTGVSPNRYRLRFKDISTF
ncbi:helix-turn-helix domain-containing protein [uncultured Sneathiella sp.]|jgi:transcriptional regulator GlxA family with amidase domain|uniref:GlxA family transcriptional regulator n=1 Tax=uncultured Sneathiella sp. TaxID=879315 RepID=UPI0030D86DB1|tara:strand:- start:313 stop:1338 length:1026 start_codon:yes stop_codon:yes gene_type:complete